MTKLFVAIGIPHSVTQKLMQLQPAAAPKVRLVQREQMHITLRYIGDDDIERINTALERIVTTEFLLQIQSTGYFQSSRGPTILWAGVKENALLTTLHNDTTSVLTQIGIKPEARSYMPHVTLARCGKSVASGVVASFMKNNVSLPVIPVKTFSLYSSRTEHGVLVYTPERMYPLQKTESLTANR